MSDCSRLITIAKRIEPVGGGSEIECQSECDCDGTRLVTVVQRVRMELRGIWCDELSTEIPDGSKIEADITHHIRLPSRCGAWIGYHDGTFQISGGSLQIVGGRMRATHGFAVHESSDQLCCDYMKSEGLMLAATESGDERLNGCRLIANYQTVQEIGPETDPCDPLAWHYWGLTFSGLLTCPCL